MSEFAAARRRMVDCQVRPSDVTDLRIIEAMLDVPRELFVPARLRPMAYLDQDLSVSESGSSPRFMIRAALLARMLQAVAIAPTDKVLVVGCASGYAAAVAAKLGREVVATESAPALVAAAKDAIGSLGIGNVSMKQGAAAEGAPAEAPFDVILINGAWQAGAETLQEQLSIGGRLVGVCVSGGTERATIVRRSATDFGDRVLFDAAAPVLPGLERPAAFVF